MIHKTIVFRGIIGESEGSSRKEKKTIKSKGAGEDLILDNKNNNTGTFPLLVKVIHNVLKEPYKNKQILSMDWTQQNQHKPLN